jgi:phage terminase large subunit-like protein
VTISPVAVKSDAEPRVCRYPRYAYSSGPDAVDLAAMAGLHLDPWQQLVLEHALGERPDGKWAAFEVAVIVARQNGKGSILEALELAGLFLFGERLILHSAHEYRTAMEAFRRVRDLIDGCRDLRRKVAKVINTNGEEGIELRTGQRLKFTARSKGAGRGFSADRLIWDEAFALTEDQVDAQMPTLSARPNPQIIYTSSPPLDAVSGAQLFRVRRRALAGDPVLAYFDWGAGREPRRPVRRGSGRPGVVAGDEPVDDLGA